MKLTSPYKCNYCLNTKAASNHWWLRPSIGWLIIMPSFELIPWDATKAEEENIEHICSESCASKALSKWMAQRANAGKSQPVSTDQGSANP